MDFACLPHEWLPGGLYFHNRKGRFWPIRHILAQKKSSLAAESKKQDLLASSGPGILNGKNFRVEGRLVSAPGTLQYYSSKDAGWLSSFSVRLWRGCVLLSLLPMCAFNLSMWKGSSSRHLHQWIGQWAYSCYRHDPKSPLYWWMGAHWYKLAYMHQSYLRCMDFHLSESRTRRASEASCAIAGGLSWSLASKPFCTWAEWGKSVSFFTPLLKLLLSICAHDTQEYIFLDIKPFHSDCF